MLIFTKPHIFIFQKTSVSGIPSQNQIQPSLMQQHGKNVYNQQPFQPNNHQMQQQAMYTNHQQPQSMGMYQNQMPVQQPKTEQIYAPVAHLQQKMIHQQKQASAQQVAKFSRYFWFLNWLGLICCICIMQD